MGVHSGRFGAVNGISTVRNWSITDDMTNPAYKASNTAAGTGRISGIEMWTGSFGIYGAIPPVMPGEIFTFAGYSAPDDDAVGSDGTTAEGSAIVDSLAINFNFQTGDIISQVINFSGHLGLTWTDADDVLTDSSAPDVPPICGCKVDYSSNGSDFSTLSDILQATLTITAANQAYVNSSTGCTTGRKPGPIDWTAAITRQSTAKTLTKGADYVWRFYTDSNSYYQMKWGKVKNFSNFNVDIESGKIVDHVINLEMNGFVGGTTGTITVPDAGSAWWPFT